LGIRLIMLVKVIKGYIHKSNRMYWMLYECYMNVIWIDLRLVVDSYIIKFYLMRIYYMIIKCMSCFKYIITYIFYIINNNS